VNKCPVAGYDCPYALSDESPLPCFANPEQCKAWRDKMASKELGLNSEEGKEKITRKVRMD
jgi:hypothetical protein